MQFGRTELIPNIACPTMQLRKSYLRANKKVKGRGAKVASLPKE